jgi:hypothetical protein
VTQEKTKTTQTIITSRLALTILVVQLLDLPRISSLQHHVVVKLIPEGKRSQSGPGEVRNWAEDQSVKCATEQVTEDKDRKNAGGNLKLHG